MLASKLAQLRARNLQTAFVAIDGGYVNMLMNLVPRPGFDEKPG